jgi:hypothetical protein
MPDNLPVIFLNKLHQKCEGGNCWVNSMARSYRMKGQTLNWTVAGMMLLALAACGQPKINPTAGGGGLTGTWVPQAGGYTASFDNGAFSTTASDTGNLISQGRYLAISENEVQLSWSSNITGLENSASCNRPNPDMLECVDAGGKSFVLRRTPV